jgi:hypothetical protein
MHHVRVEKKGYAARESSVVAEASERTAVAFVLQPLGGDAPAPAPAEPTVPAPGAKGEPSKPPGAAGPVGTLRIRVTPYAAYYVDGKLMVEKGQLADIPLKAGPHRVKAVHPWFDPKEWDINIETRRTTPLVYDFPVQERGSIVLKANKDGDVYVDGEKVNRTPCVIDGLKAGPHVIEVRLDVYERDKGPRSVEVKSGMTEQIKVKLNKAKR